MTERRTVIVFAAEPASDPTAAAMFSAIRDWMTVIAEREGGVVSDLAISCDSIDVTRFGDPLRRVVVGPIAASVTIDQGITDVDLALRQGGDDD